MRALCGAVDRSTRLRLLLQRMAIQSEMKNITTWLSAGIVIVAMDAVVASYSPLASSGYGSWQYAL